VRTGLKQPYTETGSSTRTPPQPHLALVSPDLQGVSVVPVVMGMSQLLGVLQVSPFWPVTGIAMAMIAGPSSSGSGHAEPLAKKARHWSFLLVSSQYGVVRRFTPLPFFWFMF
jgi:hypothetical protein